jgi:hypothetical protein
MGRKRLKTVIFSMIGLAIACSTICSIIFLYPALVDEIIIYSITWSLDGTQLAITDNSDIQLLTIVKDDEGIPISVIEHPIVSFCEINCPYINGGLAFTPDGQHLIAGMNYKLWIINIDQQDGELFPINRSN